MLIERLRSHPAYQTLVYGLLTLALVLLAFQVTRLGRDYAYGAPGSPDLLAYWGAGQILRAGENPYDYEKLYQLQVQHGSTREGGAVSREQKMFNPPWLLVWIYPLLCLPLLQAAVVWLCLSGAMFLLSSTLIWRTVSDPTAGRPVGIAWVASVAFVPLLSTLQMGQVTGIVLFGLAGFLYFIARDRDFLGGAALALTTFKPHLVYLVWLAAVWWVVTRRRWQLVAGAAAVLLPTLAALAVFWPEALFGYRIVLADPPLYFRTPTVGGLLRLLVFPENRSVQLFVPVLIGSCLLAYLLVRRPAWDWRASLGPLLLLSVPTGPYGWSFDQVVLLVPYLQVVAWLAEDRVAGSSKVIVLVTLLLMAVMMLVQDWLQHTDEWYFWVPWTLGAVYLYGRCSIPHAHGALNDATPRPVSS